MADLRNDFKPFAVESDADVMPQNQWDEGILRRQGHVPGLASQFLANKAERQGTLGAAAIGELINRAGLNAIDNGDPAQLTDAFQAAVIYMAQEMLFSLLRPTAPEGKPVLICYDPVSETIFGYPMDEMPQRADRLHGGDLATAVVDYPDGRVSGGDLTTAVADYPDGKLSGGSLQNL